MDYNQKLESLTPHSRPLSAKELVIHCLDILNSGGPPHLQHHELLRIWNNVTNRVRIENASLQLLGSARLPLLGGVYEAKLNKRGSLQRNMASQSGMMSGTPTVARFLQEVSAILRSRDSDQLQTYLIIEPPYNQIYESMRNELRQSYPAGTEDTLEMICASALPETGEAEDGSTWSPFVKFIVAYFGFLRDVNIDNLLDTFQLLLELVQKANSALVSPNMGILILPTIVNFSRMLAKLAIGLDKQPALIRHIPRPVSAEGMSETLPERAANTIRQAFVTCLNDRTGGPNPGLANRPEGKKAGVYRLANICLKILFVCKKPHNCEQIFLNVYNQSPLLSLYPKSEQVTYLYYLGRFWFNNKSYFRAQKALQQAYNECPQTPESTGQRRHVLIHLIASNILLGRFPSKALLSRPEAWGLDEVFSPICSAIRRGNIGALDRLLEPESDITRWLLNFKIYLQIRFGCRVLVWRSIARKAFISHGTQFEAQSRKAPTLAFEDFANVLSEFAKVTEYCSIPRPIWVSAESIGHPIAKYPDPLLPNVAEAESIIMSLISQKLLVGYTSHRMLKFAIQGAAKKGALAAGFPNPWAVMKAKSPEDVPGWKQDGNGINSGGIGPGVTINLTGARPVGSG